MAAPDPTPVPLAAAAWPPLRLEPDCARRLVFIAAALLPPAVSAWVLWLAPLDGLTADRTAMAARDFTALWTAGRIAAQHAAAALSDPASFTAIARAWFGPGFPEQIWPYPPTTLLLAAPFSTLPLGPSFALYTALTALLLWLASRPGGLRPIACTALLFSPAVAENALAGQNGALTAALLIGGLSLLDRRPALAGILLGMLAIKPQFALLLPVCLIAGQRWRTLLGAAGTAGSLALASLLLFGPSFWTEFLTRAQPVITAYLETPWDGRPSQQIFASLFMAARALGAPLGLAYVAQAALTLLCAVLAWRAWRLPQSDPQLRTALTASLALAASPWVHTYDTPALAVSVIILLPRIPNTARPLLALAWLWPGATSLLSLPPLLPVLSLASVIWLAWRQVTNAETPRPGERTTPALALALLAALMPATSAHAQDDSRTCDAAAARAERDWNVPIGILAAVGTVESGRQRGQLGAAPWPWTINAAGRGAYFATREDAVAAVLAVMARGYPYIDVGCFQIDLAYHPGVFRSLDEAFDPDRNAQAAAQILAAERARAGNWATAVARYHSATPMRGGPYLDRVRAALPLAKLRATSALFEVAWNDPSAQPDTAPPSPALPKVIYLAPVGRAQREPQIILMMAVAQAQPSAARP